MSTIRSSRNSTPNSWSVTIDDEQGGLDGARHLVAQGAQRIAIIAGPKASEGSHRRVAGQIAGLGEHFNPELIVRESYASSGGVHGMAALLERDASIDAVLCGSDRQAIGAISVLHSHGLKVPDDVRVVGFDDHSFAATAMPPLTTIAQPILDLGASAARMLSDVVAGKQVTSIIFPTHLIIRQSA